MVFGGLLCMWWSAQDEEEQTRLGRRGLLGKAAEVNKCIRAVNMEGNNQARWVLATDPTAVCSQARSMDGIGITALQVPAASTGCKYPLPSAVK